jgi:hypothetical protein
MRPVPEKTGAIDRLPAEVRHRLEAFSQAIERVRVEDMAMYATNPDREAHQRALDEAELVAIESGREPAVKDARSRLIEFIIREYGDSQYRPTWIGLNWGQSPGTTHDRVRVMRSLADAIAALVLWDLLDEGAREVLLGPWGSLVA